MILNTPPNSGSQYFNYKNQFSIVLLGICDADYKFIYFNVGAYGSESDGGIFKDSELGQKLQNNSIDLPQSEPVHGSNFDVPYCFLGDAAFPLSHYLMVPYDGRNLDDEQIFFNEEHSKGRVRIENAFGILSAYWRVFLKRMTVHPKNADKVACACVLLHNFIISSNQSNCINNQIIDRINGDTIAGSWREDAQQTTLQPLQPNMRAGGGRNATQSAIEIRNKVKSLIHSQHI